MSREHHLIQSSSQASQASQPKLPRSIRGPCSPLLSKKGGGQRERGDGGITHYVSP